MLCLVTTHTHVNYKLLLLYRICYRVYTEITKNKLYVKWTTLPLASSTTTLLSTIYLNESRYVDRDSITCQHPNTQSDLLCLEPVKKCRTKLRTMQLNPTLSMPFFEVTHTASQPPCAPHTLPLLRHHLALQHTSSSSSNILSYMCHALKLS